MRCPFAEWRPSPNFSRGAVGGHRGLSFHHIVGTIANAESRFLSRSGGASAHFGIGDDGRLVQWVDTDDASWAQCRGNYEGWMTIEFESPSRGDVWRGNTPQANVTAARLLLWTNQVYGVPLKLASSRDDRGLAYHSMVPGLCSAHWGQTGCPGDNVIADRQRVIDIASGLDVGTSPDWGSIEAAFMQAAYRAARVGKADGNMLVLNVSYNQYYEVINGRARGVSAAHAIKMWMGMGKLFAPGVEGIPQGLPLVHMADDEFKEWVSGNQLQLVG